jgi:hypothetical protein
MTRAGSQRHKKKKIFQDENLSEYAACVNINPLNAELNPICYLLALLAHHFLTLAG